MASWTSYPAQVEHHTVTGDLRVYRDLYSPQLDNRRGVLAWLPAALLFIWGARPQSPDSI